MIGISSRVTPGAGSMSFMWISIVSPLLMKPNGENFGSKEQKCKLERCGLDGSISDHFEILFISKTKLMKFGESFI